MLETVTSLNNSIYPTTEIEESQGYLPSLNHSYVCLQLIKQLIELRIQGVANNSGVSHDSQGKKQEVRVEGLTSHLLYPFQEKVNYAPLQRFLVSAAFLAAAERLPPVAARPVSFCERALSAAC